MSTRRGIGALRALLGGQLGERAAGGTESTLRPPADPNGLVDLADPELALILHGDLGEVHAARIGGAGELDLPLDADWVRRTRPRQRRRRGRGPGDGLPGDRQLRRRPGD